MSPVGRDDLGFKIKTISKLLTTKHEQQHHVFRPDQLTGPCAWLPVLSDPTAGDGLSAGY